MKVCKHQPHSIYQKIKSPKWSTNEFLISKEYVDKANDLIIFRFTDQTPKDKYGWLVVEKKVVRRHKIQENGRGLVYVVPLAKAEQFEEYKNCEHQASLF